MFASGKDGISALSVQRTLDRLVPTAWAMLHRLRAVLVRPGRDRLAGTVEVDETYMGGEDPVTRRAGTRQKDPHRRRRRGPRGREGSAAAGWHR